MIDTQRKLLELAPMLAVPDVASTARFYEEKLGFEIDFVMDEPTLLQYGVVHRDYGRSQWLHCCFWPSSRRNLRDFFMKNNFNIVQVQQMYRCVEQ